MPPKMIIKTQDKILAHAVLHADNYCSSSLLQVGQRLNNKITKAATNSYFHNLLIPRFFYSLID